MKKFILVLLLSVLLVLPNCVHGANTYYVDPDTGIVNAPGVLITGLTASEIVFTDASKNLTSVAPAALTKTNDTNVTLTLGGSPTTALLSAASLTLGWTGTLAAARLNSNVVQTITNDTNVTGSITSQILTLGWTGLLAVSRGGLGSATFTPGYLPYYNGTIFANSPLYTDGTNIGVNQPSPVRRLECLDASDPQLRLSQVDTTSYVDFRVASSTTPYTLTWPTLIPTGGGYAKVDDAGLMTIEAGTAGTTMVTYQVEVSGDDTLISDPGNNFSGTPSNLEAGVYSGVTYNSSFKFNSVIIPQGAVILNANFILTSASDLSGTSATRIYGDDSDSATAPTSYATFTGKSLTTAYTDWDITSAWVLNTVYTSPAITSIIQEIIDRAGWVSGNNLQLFWKNNSASQARTCWGYNGSSSQAAKLTITFQVSGTHTLLNATTHTDTLTGSVQTGDLIYGNATPKWARLAKGNQGYSLSVGTSLPNWTQTWVNVGDFGTTTADIQNAVNSLPSTGGFVIIPAGTYLGTSTLYPQGSDVTRNGVHLIGTDPEDVIIKWNYAGGGTVVSYPTAGWGYEFSGIKIDCNGYATTGLNLVSISNSIFRQFKILDTANGGKALNLTSSGANWGGHGNTISNFIITETSGTTHDYYGIYMHGDTANNSDWHENVFQSGWIGINDSSSLMTKYPVVLDFTDSNTFIDVDILNENATTKKGVLLNNTYSVYPENNWFYGCSVRNVENSAGYSGGFNNFINASSPGDGEIIPYYYISGGVTYGTPYAYGTWRDPNTGILQLWNIDYEIRKEVPKLRLTTGNGTVYWDIANNAAASTGDYGFLILKGTTGYFNINPNASYGGDATNPTFIFVNGSLHKVTVGATDSGGTGYRYLRVPN